MTPRYKHRCPGCHKLLFISVMYCRNCVAAYPERRGVTLHDGQQKWLKGHKLLGVPPVEPSMVVVIYNRRICLECGSDLTVRTKHKCYTKSWASGYRGNSIVCTACSVRKELGYFPIIMRRVRGNCRNDTIRVSVCSECLNGKPVELTQMRRSL
jgi:hypothetical protein